MKLLALAALAITAKATNNYDKCQPRIKIGGPPRYTTPRTIANGNNQPAAINFLISKRGELMEVFGAGQKPQEFMLGLVGNKLMTLNTFAEATEDPYMGQVFHGLRRDFRGLVHDGELEAKDQDAVYAGLFRDNTQRLEKVLRDISFSPELMLKIVENTDFTLPLKAMVEANSDNGAVYINFVGAHIEKFVPWIKAQYSAMVLINDKGAKNLVKLFMDEKMKQNYRSLVNELPLVYQFFNDNIDFIQLNNVDKSLEEAVARDILLVMAEQAEDTQIHSMIERHRKFIKKLMVHRAEQQQTERVVEKVMEKNTQLREAAYDEEEFEKLKKEAMDGNKQLTADLEKEIWQQVKNEKKSKQKVEKYNQMETAKTNSQQEQMSITRYEHLVGIVGLMPDELLDTIAQMVRESCPELDLIRILDADMKEIMEAQPVNFIDQLLKELHDVCDMFGLVDESKIIKVMGPDGVEIEIYAADWMDGEKKTW